MTRLLAHFTWEEFASGDGAKMPSKVKANIPKLAAMLTVLRAEISAKVGKDTPLLINSGYRSPAWNKKVGGTTNSYHLKGLAADVSCQALSPRRVQAIVTYLQDLGIIGGIGSYPGFTHVDLGPKREWAE